MDEEASGSTSAYASAATDVIIRRLEKRGWSLVDSEDVLAIVAISRALADHPHDDNAVADAVESELLNTDLRSVGAKSLPDSSALRNLAYLVGPKILQVSEVRDISRSSIEDGFTDSSRNRMFRFALTDGHNQVTAVEYTRIATIDGDVIPGTKVRLEGKVPLHSGILCLNTAALTVLGGIVQSLHEEWHVNKKSALSRESLRTHHQDGNDGPPPFEKLQIGQLSQPPAKQAKRQQYFESTTRGHEYDRGQHSGAMINRSIAEHKTLEVKQDMKDKSVRNLSLPKPEESQSNPEARPKEVAEAAPVQNQAAAKKLLQKMSEPVTKNHHSRGRKSRDRGRHEETPVFTLDEWERKNSAVKPALEEEFVVTSCDEELAWQLQNQLDMEDAHDFDFHETEAEKIRRGMFSYGGEYEGPDSGGRVRGRGRGRGRGRWRGRGRGGGRGRGRGLGRHG